VVATVVQGLRMWASRSSGVGTVAAIAALATTLFSPVLIFIALTLKF